MEKNERRMKFLKYFENIDPFTEDDWDFDEEEHEERTYKDIPLYQEIGNGFNQKDRMRIVNLLARSKDFEHSLRLANTMANRITHLDKAIERGNACLIGAYGLTDEQKLELSSVFHNRAKKIYFG